MKMRPASEEYAVQPMRNYKDRIFRMIFKDRKNLLELYNAVNGTNYQNPEEMIVTTLENAIYVGMKNDLSFILYDYLSLYEHQSTKNPNMPLRNLLYISEVYSDLTKSENLYSSRLVRIPAPRFLVFYNGLDPMPEKMEQRLSDAYFQGTDDPKLELCVTVLNINLGYNQELAQNCRILWEYMTYVAKIREHEKNHSLAQAVELTIEECIQEGILKEFLEKNRAEVKKVSIFEYDEEQHMRLERREARIDGERIGNRQHLIRQICRKLEKGKASEVIAEELEEELDEVNKIVCIAEELREIYSVEELQEKILERLEQEEPQI